MQIIIGRRKVEFQPHQGSSDFCTKKGWCNVSLWVRIARYWGMSKENTIHRKPHRTLEPCLPWVGLIPLTKQLSAQTHTWSLSGRESSLPVKVWDGPRPSPKCPSPKGVLPHASPSLASPKRLEAKILSPIILSSWGEGVRRRKGGLDEHLAGLLQGGHWSIWWGGGTLFSK